MKAKWTSPGGGRLCGRRLSHPARIVRVVAPGDERADALKA